MSKRRNEEQKSENNPRLVVRIGGRLVPESKLREEKIPHLMEKLVEKLTVPPVSTPGAVAEAIFIKYKRALAEGPKASAQARRIATQGNVTEWRSAAFERWKQEFLDAATTKPSTRKEMAKAICSDLKNCPAVGTVGNAIKGVKAKAKKAADREKRNG
jgi:hypothetical protein